MAKATNIHYLVFVKQENQKNKPHKLSRDENPVGYVGGEPVQRYFSIFNKVILKLIRYRRKKIP